MNSDENIKTVLGLLNKLSDDELHLVNDRIIGNLKMRRENKAMSFYPGMSVWFYSRKRNRKVEGKVTKVNRQTVAVTENNNGINMVWRVSPELLKTSTEV